MGIFKNDVKLEIIRPILLELDMWSQSAENLLMGTCAKETLMGQYLTQIEGPALGIFQMENPTYIDIYQNVIPALSTKRKKILEKYYIFVDHIEDSRRLVWDLKFATIFCRFQYWRHPEPLPSSDDVQGLAHYWKTYYNTQKGKGTVEEFIECYQHYVS